MKVTRYKYSAGRMLFDLVLWSVITIMLYATIMDHNAGPNSWLVFASFLLIILVRLVYLAVMYYIPCFRDKTALELDEEKIQLFITGKLLFQIPKDLTYWKEITDIKFINPPKGSAIISFTLKDGSAFGFRTAYIAGKDKDIYNTVMEYYNYKRQSNA